MVNTEPARYHPRDRRWTRRVRRAPRRLRLVRQLRDGAVQVYGGGMAEKQAGFFAEASWRFPRLRSRRKTAVRSRLRDNFVKRVFAYVRLRAFAPGGGPPATSSAPHRAQDGAAVLSGDVRNSGWWRGEVADRAGLEQVPRAVHGRPGPHGHRAQAHNVLNTWPELQDLLDADEAGAAGPSRTTASASCAHRAAHALKHRAAPQGGYLAGQISTRTRELMLRNHV
jgi:hypothetical protein